MKITDAEVILKTSKHVPVTSGSRTRGTEASAVTQQRTIRRRLQELTNENYKEVKIDTPTSFTKSKQGKTVNSRRVLGSKKTLANVFDDDTASAEYYYSLVAEPSKYSVKLRCNVCGYFGNTKCSKCGASSCSLTCVKLHTLRCSQ
ncbi:hypothetical protein DASB73_028210 [Starmerella bacillaris]|uniref:HIT-type domain-containing protein n=1 Tax=Starmerella bacillaris TaxID=1247836 RepID=A0AAV5RK92_STABA|nr:hypothetical protein DASB73_028210 [Starmerella bacillaris]